MQCSTDGAIIATRPHLDTIGSPGSSRNGLATDEFAAAQLASNKRQRRTRVGTAWIYGERRLYSGIKNIFE